MRKTLFILCVAALVAGTSGIAGAQTKSQTDATYVEGYYVIEVVNATVVAVYGNFLVLQRENGEVYEYEVPEDWRFNVDGRKLRASELKPGTKLTAQVKTTTTEKQVRTVTVRTGEVVHVQGRTVIVRGPEGVKKVRVPKDFVFFVDGKPKKVSELRKGMKIAATIVSDAPPEVLTEQDLASEIRGTAPPERIASTPPTKPAPQQAAARLPAQLPKTASRLPLIGLLGLASLFFGAALALIRRFQSRADQLAESTLDRRFG